MTYVEVLSQMQAIQTRLAQLAPARSSATGASTFATALDGASASTAVDGTAATSSVSGATLAADGVTGDDVVQAALQYKGVPYVLGGESKSGIDCSGLVQASFKDLGVDVPRLVHEQQTIGQKVDSLKDAKPGDLIVLNGGDHIAIWAGNDTVIHAPYPGRSVSVQKAWFTDKDVVTIRRVVPASGDTTAAPVSGATAGLAASSGTSASGLSSSTLAQASALLAMGGGDSGSDSSSLASMLSSAGLTGGTGSSSTAQQLLAARSALIGA